MLNPEQLTAIKYYEGDVEGNDPFWGDGKAYLTINSLFFPDLENEKKRTLEGKKLNPAIIEQPERICNLCKDLLSAFKEADLSKNRHTYRVERYHDYLEMVKAGGTVGFTSTSTDGFLKYYTDRIGIALLEFDIKENVPVFPYAEMLKDDYAKSNEAEVLLPPGLKITFTPVELTNQDKEIVDAEGLPPKIKCQATVQGVLPKAGFTPSLDLLNSKELVSAGQRVYKALNDKEEPNEKDIEQYILWKNNFRDLVLKENE